MWLLLLWLMPNGARKLVVVIWASVALFVCLLLVASFFVEVLPAAWTRATAPARTARVPAPLAPSTAEGAPATIRVWLPAEANLWVQGIRTTQTGRSRLFQTPPLDPDQENDYVLRAGWVTGEGVVDQTRHVKVHAGGKSEVDFTRPDPAATP